jgi:translation initiation factor 2 beta subunit (eIF-2beta)/eIF-5
MILVSWMTEPTGRAKNYVKCWNCDGYIGKKLLREDWYDNQCPLCGAEGIVKD